MVQGSELIGVRLAAASCDHVKFAVRQNRGGAHSTTPTRARSQNNLFIIRQTSLFRVNRLEFLLVPKLHLGTQLVCKALLCLMKSNLDQETPRVISLPKHSLGHNCVPKCNLGTRKKTPTSLPPLHGLGEEFGEGAGTKSLAPSPKISQHILFRQTEIPVAADDQVVVDCQVEGLPGLHQGPGQFLVGGGGF